MDPAARSTDACATLCLQKDMCRAYSYHSKLRICLLSDSGSTVLVARGPAHRQYQFYDRTQSCPTPLTTTVLTTTPAAAMTTSAATTTAARTVVTTYDGAVDRVP